MKSHLYKLFGIFMLLSFGGILNAQINTLYNMAGMPQQLFQNPAFQSNCNAFVLIPSAPVNFNTTAFSFNDAFNEQTVTNSQGESELWLVPDLETMYSKMAKVNYVSINEEIPVLGFGFKTKKSYFSFQLQAVAGARFGIPKAALGIKDGNWNFETNEPRTIDFSGLGVDVNSYLEAGFGLSRTINHRLTVGARFKFLKGLANVQTKNSTLIIDTDQSKNLSFETDYLIRTSIPVEVIKEDGEISEVNLPDIDANWVLQHLLESKNRGMAIDLGATYELNNKITLSAALINLGYIRWKESTEFSAEGNFNFPGIDFSDFLIADEQNPDEPDLATTLTDSIMGSIKFDASDEPITYSNGLSPNFYLGANYNLLERLDVGILTRTDIYDGRFRPKLTLSANTYPTNWLALSASYSMMNRTYNNLGLGFSLRFLGLQLFMVTDNLTSVLNPKDARGLNMRMGVNLVFGCKKKVDEALIDTEGL